MWIAGSISVLVIKKWEEWLQTWKIKPNMNLKVFAFISVNSFIK